MNTLEEIPLNALEVPDYLPDDLIIVSELAEDIIGSEIIQIAAEVNKKIKLGEKIYNFTIGDFNPKIFSIPSRLKSSIIRMIENDETNYPPSNGEPELRNAVSNLLKARCELDYDSDQILIACGARPIIETIFQTVVNPGDKVVFPTPSWNNNHYTYLSRANSMSIETTPNNKFMPTATELQPHISTASLIALCSPLNPTGTTFRKEDLEKICDLILDENLKRAKSKQKPLYLMYDQIYWALTFGDTKHYNPVTLRPKMRNYTIFVDGISKSLAATGLRVGWGFGPKKIISKMSDFLTHKGAWSPKAEQLATAEYLKDLEGYDLDLMAFKEKVNSRLVRLYDGFQTLKSEGFNVDVIAPEAAIYLTVQFALHGKITEDGKKLETTKDITQYILDEAKVAMVPFYAFGSSKDSNWYRLSVGKSKIEEIPDVFKNLRNALAQLR